MIGGGDGTFGWVLSALQEIGGHLACHSPPCAVLPLGTGVWVCVCVNENACMCVCECVSV